MKDRDGMKVPTLDWRPDGGYIGVQDYKNKCLSICGSAESEADFLWGLEAYVRACWFWDVRAPRLNDMQRSYHRVIKRVCKAKLLSEVILNTCNGERKHGLRIEMGAGKKMSRFLVPDDAFRELVAELQKRHPVNVAEALDKWKADNFSV
jgi:hypothetical protein